jgi:hypothetical protein
VAVVVRYIFEDNGNSPISKLLCKCANNNMYFSNGNELLYDTIECIREKFPNDIIKVYVDVSPSSRHLEALYDSLCRMYNKYSNIYIIPYICIEYVVLKMLYEYGYLVFGGELANLIENTVAKFQWNNVPDKYKDNEYIKSSLEHTYKFILSNISLKCMWNDTRNYVHGLFYLQDCSCDRKYCKTLNCTDNLRLKAERLYTTLPSYDAFDDEQIKFWNEQHIKYKLLCMREVYDNVQNMYDEICVSMKLQRFYVNIKE